VKLKPKGWNQNRRPSGLRQRESRRIGGAFFQRVAKEDVHIRKMAAEGGLKGGRWGGGGGGKGGGAKPDPFVKPKKRGYRD